MQSSVTEWAKAFVTHTVTVTQTHTCIVFATARTNYMAPIQGVSQQEVTRLVVPLAAETPALSPQLHGPLYAVGTHLRASKTR